MYFSGSVIRLIVFVFFLSLVSRSKAQDNPFGFPIAREKDRPGTVMLHGGGYGLSDEIRHEFVRLAGGADARIVLIPSDQMLRGYDNEGKPIANGESRLAYESRLSENSNYGRWVDLQSNRQIEDFQFAYRDRENDPEDAKLIAALEQATGVWLPAYDQEWHPKEFAADYPKVTSRFQVALRDVLARGGVVGGLGGGMSCLPETIIAGNREDEGGWRQAEIRFGLALLTGVIVDQNFSSVAGRLERFTDLLRNGRPMDRLGGEAGVGRRTIGLGVDRQTALILQGNTIRAIGESQGHIFLKSNGDRTITWRTLTAGDDPLVLQPSSANPKQQKSSLDSEALAQLNPFGLPEPIEPTQFGRVVLHGGGDTDEIIEDMPILSGRSLPRIVHCPAARDNCRPSSENQGKELYDFLESEFSQWRQLQKDGRIESLNFITSNNSSDANNLDFVRVLTQADALWFCGGDQTPLSTLFVNRQRPTLFQLEAMNIVRRGGVVGGSSAGLAIMADLMIEGGDNEDGEPASADLSRGLGLLKNVLAEQHFDARGGRIERLTGLLRDHKRLANFLPTCQPKRMIALAVEEDTALIVSSNHLQVAGKKLAHIFLQSEDPREVTWHALQPGDTAVLLPESGGFHLQLEDWHFHR
jgi:cyanophycinase